MGGRFYTITPLDTLFFRDGRPFVAGEGTDASSLFPPTPFTVQGLVRSMLLANEEGCKKGWVQYKEGCGTCDIRQNCEVKEIVGSLDGQYGSKLRIKGPWIAARYKDSQDNGREKQAILFPCPLDLIALSSDLSDVHSKNQGTIKTAILNPEAKKPDSNLPEALKHLGPPARWKGKDFEGVGGWVSWEAFKEYLSGNAPELNLKENWWRASDLWDQELRPGLEMEDGRNHAREGHLYFARHIRLKDGVCLVVELAGLGSLGSKWTKFPLTPFGGERRSVAIEESPMKTTPWSAIEKAVEQKIQTTRNVKLVLTHMAWFKEGWTPAAWDRKQGQAAFDGNSYNWVAFRMERPLAIGGWDLARGEQKPVRRFVPAGSVYYLDDVNNIGSVLNALETLNSCISETPPSDQGRREPFTYPDIGLGHVFIGTW